MRTYWHICLRVHLRRPTSKASATSTRAVAECDNDLLASCYDIAAPTPTSPQLDPTSGYSSQQSSQSPSKPQGQDSSKSVDMLYADFGDESGGAVADVDLEEDGEGAVFSV